MKCTMILVTLCLLLFSCKKQESYQTEVYGKWKIIGGNSKYMYLGTVDISETGSINWGTVAVECSITDSTIYIPKSDKGPDALINYTLLKNFLVLTYRDGFTMLLYPDGKELPPNLPPAKTGIIGSWKKENHQLRITSDGEFLITGDAPATYRVLDKGVLSVEQKIQAGYRKDDGSYCDYNGSPIDADEMYTALTWIVPFSLKEDSLTINYLGDNVTYTRE